MSAQDIYLRTGPFTTHLRTAIPDLIADIDALYDRTQITSPAAFADFHVEVAVPFLRRRYRPKAQFIVDGEEPFRPLPIDQALPIFEWGLNWCVSSYANQFLILHAATVAKGGRAVVMPGAPGSGKSTLAAALVHRGWRLLSDELTLVLPDSGTVIGLGRPISLKNESIEVIREFVPTAHVSRVAHDTAKGRVAMLKAPRESVARIAEPARPTWIVFPKYLNGLPAVLERRPKAHVMFELVRNSFNHGLHGHRGFAMLADIVDACSCYRFTYQLLDAAVETFEELAARC